MDYCITYVPVWNANMKFLVKWYLRLHQGTVANTFPWLVRANVHVTHKKWLHTVPHRQMLYKWRMVQGDEETKAKLRADVKIDWCRGLACHSFILWLLSFILGWLFARWLSNRSKRRLNSTRSANLNLFVYFYVLQMPSRSRRCYDRIWANKL